MIFDLGSAQVQAMTGECRPPVPPDVGILSECRPRSCHPRNWNLDRLHSLSPLRGGLRRDDPQQQPWKAGFDDLAGAGIMTGAEFKAVFFAATGQ